MRFNYGYEKRKFDNNWKRLRAEYTAAGMSEEAIEEMYRFDLEAFNAERAYCKHTCLMKSFSVTESPDDGDDAGTAYGKNRLQEKLSVEMPLTDPDRRYGWIDELDDEEIAKQVMNMEREDQELITLYAIEGYSVMEIASKLQVSHPTISKKLKRIRKNFSFFQNMATD